MSIKSGSVLECDQLGPHGRPVAAKIGYNGDYFVAEQAYPDQDTPDLIARKGDKVSRGAAEKLYPELKNLYYRE